MSGFAEQFKGRWIVDLFNLILRTAPTLWWADGHRVVPRGDGIEVMGHPSDGPEPDGAPAARLLGQTAGRQLNRRPKPRLQAGAWAPKRGPLVKA